MPELRERLSAMLADAARLEHDILCGYLHAAFTLKGEGDDLQPHELAAVQKWRGTLLKVAREEMQHLAQVWNLASAIGARPHLARLEEGDPAAPYAANVVLRLSPLDADTVDHFVFLERPKLARVADGRPYADEAAQRAPDAASASRVPPFETIGDFYAQLRRELLDADSRLGTEQLLCGAPGRQLQPGELGLRGLRVVDGIDAAMHAVDAIVEQGEGAGEVVAQPSHYHRFQLLQAEYRRLQAERPAFRPYVGFDADSGTGSERAACALGQAAAERCHAAMLRGLALTYEFDAREAGTRRALVGASLAAMHALAHLASWLVRSHSPAHAGLRFSPSGSGAQAPPDVAPRAAVADWRDELEALQRSVGALGPGYQPAASELARASSLLSSA